jgi:hypothetical protein
MTPEEIRAEQYKRLQAIQDEMEAKIAEDEAKTQAQVEAGAEESDGQEAEKDG